MWLRAVDFVDIEGAYLYAMGNGLTEVSAFDRAAYIAPGDCSSVFTAGLAFATAVCDVQSDAVLLASIRRVDFAHGVGWVDCHPCGSNVPEDDSPIVGEACRALLDVAFETLGLRHVYFEYVVCRQWRPEALCVRGVEELRLPADTIVGGVRYDRVTLRLGAGKNAGEFHG